MSYDFERELGIEERLEHELLRSVCAQQADYVCTICHARFCRKNGCGNFGENGHHPCAWRPVTRKAKGVIPEGSGHSGKRK